MLKHSFLYLLLLFPLLGFTQIDYIREVTQKLTAPEMHGRGYVNGGDSIAACYIANQMRELNIQPYKKSYFQKFNFAVNTFPGKINFSSKEKVFNLGTDFLVEPESGSFEGELKVYRLNQFDRETFEEMAKNLSRALLSQNYNAFFIDVNFDSLDAGMKNSASQMMRQIAAYACVFMRNEGKWNWSVGREQYAYPIVWVNKDIPVQNGMKLTVDAKFNPKHQTQNVIGYIPGLKKSKKTFVFTAHYDHLGRLGQEVYFPGANDNASGTAALLAIGKYFKENPVDFNVMLIAFAGEEAGLLGSEHYVKNPIVKLKDIQFLLNVDIFGSGEIGITVVNGSVYPEAFDALVKINEEKQYVPRIKARGKAANSDHYHFSERGVPAFFIYTEGDNKHYHDIFDTYENLSFDKADALIQLMIKFTKEIMQLPRQKMN